MISTLAHRGRLPHVARVFVTLNPGYFPHAAQSLTLLTDYFEHTHDIVKQMSLPELRQHGYTGEADVMTRLHQYSGIHRSQMSPEFEREFLEFRDSFNRIEDKKKEAFFLLRGIAKDSPLIAEFKKIEVIVDITDVGIFRRTEFGIQTMESFDGYRHLLERGYPEEWARLSRELEVNYPLIFQPQAVIRGCPILSK